MTCHINHDNNGTRTLRALNSLHFAFIVHPVYWSVSNWKTLRTSRWIWLGRRYTITNFANPFAVTNIVWYGQLNLVSKISHTVTFAISGAYRYVTQPSSASSVNFQRNPHRQESSLRYSVFEPIVYYLIKCVAGSERPHCADVSCISFFCFWKYIFSRWHVLYDIQMATVSCLGLYVYTSAQVARGLIFYQWAIVASGLQHLWCVIHVNANQILIHSSLQTVAVIVQLGTLLGIDFCSVIAQLHVVPVITLSKW